MSLPASIHIEDIYKRLQLDKVVRVTFSDTVDALAGIRVETEDLIMTLLQWFNQPKQI